MRLVRRLMVLVVVMSLAACGDDGQDAAHTYTPDELEPVLVVADDIGQGWTEEMRDVFTTRGEGPAAIEGRRDFHGVSEQLWSSDDATDYIVAVRAAFDACVGTTWNVEDEGDASDQEVTLRALDAPDVGDMSTAAVAEVATPGPDGTYIWRSRIVVGRFGTVVMTVTELDVQLEGSEPHFTETEWANLVETAAAKVERLTAD
jgi:hypothetical protein